MSGDTIATNTAVISLAKRTDFAVARKPKDGRLVNLVKDLLPHNQYTSVSGQHFAAARAKKGSIHQQRMENASWSVGLRTPVFILPPAWR